MTTVKTRAVSVKMKRILLTALCVVVFTTLWSLVEQLDYFKGNYRDLTPIELSMFKRHADPTPVYTSYLGNHQFAFPRQQVDRIKLFQNTVIIGSLTPKTLRKEFNTNVMRFFNSSNFYSWAETTWSLREADYILRFYYKDQVVGKAYLCLEGCGMIGTRPFTPNIKFGALTEDGRKELENMLESEEMWE
jgi:hypothetical protein